MKPTAELTEDGNLLIDLDRLLGESYGSSGEPALYAKLARCAVFEEAFVSRLLDHIATGATEDGDWWSSEFAERFRKRLLPMVDDAIAELVANLTHDRDRHKTMSERWRNACWQITKEWETMDRERLWKVERPDYHVARTMTAEEAKEWMRQRSEEAEEANARSLKTAGRLLEMMLEGWKFLAYPTGEDDYPVLTLIAKMREPVGPREITATVGIGKQAMQEDDFLRELAMSDLIKRVHEKWRKEAKTDGNE